MCNFFLPECMYVHVHICMICMYLCMHQALNMAPFKCTFAGLIIAIKQINTSQANEAEIVTSCRSIFHLKLTITSHLSPVSETLKLCFQNQWLVEGRMKVVRAISPTPPDQSLHSESDEDGACASPPVKRGRLGVSAAHHYPGSGTDDEEEEEEDNSDDIQMEERSQIFSLVYLKLFGCECTFLISHLP